MSEEVRRVTEDAAAERPKVLRARSVPSAKPFRVATFLWGLHCLGLVVTLTALAAVFLHPNAQVPWIMAGGLAFSGLMWLIAFFKRRAATCPLCKGTPLVNSGAMPHLRARRVWPLNHGVCAMLSIMATQRFRCMYCGSHYDLLKERTRHSYVETPHDRNGAREPHDA
jgi:DNA-directed RNA polymerase subunit RPC12/RpoP